MRCAWVGWLFVAAFGLGGCATKYQDMSFAGGVAAEPVMTDTYRILARGNGYTAAARVEDFVLLKAAETTIAAGGSHFVVVNQSNQTSVAVGEKPGTGPTNK